MKKGIHPKYQQVLFIDSSTNFKFICGSTLQPKETEEHEGKQYPVYRLSVSSASHPFFTGGAQRFVAEGRVDKFMKRYGKKASPKKEEDKKEDEGGKDKK
ncbi:50S ribosomal protein L31 type B [Chlamydiales bacterium SCGC AB-751-O23]|jgi:large subunit ribosomal protein L31|nr:50S ribosomal protein L31 type B [Chlamydiales bacterium SCGC AB-751-O23]